MSSAERSKGAASRFALSMLKRPHFADGGPVTGPLLGTDGGRSDTQPITVPEGSYVIPADIVSGIPAAQGNSLAGHNALAKLFASLPLSPDEAPYGSGVTKLARNHTMPGLSSEKKLMEHALASGGKAGNGAGGHVPILAAHGEYVVAPEIVKRLGHGNMKLGHEILDKWVMETRERNIKELKKLPKPAKN